VNALARTRPPAIKRVLLLAALTAILSLFYGIQHYLGGPLRLTVTSEVQDLALSADGSLVAAGAQDGKVYLWDIQSNWTLHKLPGHTGPVVSVAFNPSGSTLFSASRDGTVRLWDISTLLNPGAGSGQAERVLEVPGGKPLRGASLAANGATLATLGEDGVVNIWDVATGQVLRSIGPHEKARRVVTLSPDGARVAAGDGANIQIWDARSGEPVGRLEGYWEDEATQEEWLGHKGEVTALAFSPDGELLVSGSTDKTILFWDPESGRVIGSGEGHYASITRLVFNQEGNSVLSGSADNKAKTWRVPGGKVSATFIGHLGTVKGVAYGSDAATILSAGDDGTVRLWDVVSTSVSHTEWTQKGLQPIWGKLFGVWMLVSGLVGLVCLGGLWRLWGWGHLLALALYIVGPIIVLGLPLLDTISYPFSLGTRLGIAWPLLVPAAWYAGLVVALMREAVVLPYEAPRGAALAEQLMTSLRTRKLRSGLFIGAVWVLLLVALYSVLRRFNLDIAFMGHFFSFIMKGAGTTVQVSAASIALAVILALLGALGRLSRNPIANGISGFYISLIRGTPLLVQIYIWYLGLARLGIVLDPLLAGILALGVNYGAYMTEIFRAGMQAINIGQHEAAQALGMSRTQTLRRIVLPQAFRIVIPPIGNEFIAMMKDSSLVSVITVWELTFRASRLGRQYFRNMETFLIAAGFYWVLTMVFQFLQGKLEVYMARGERR
jgi:polar amino acid transport system permease protein